MCGIAGWLDSTVSMYEKKDVLEAMQRTLQRRGPDDIGIYLKDHIGFVHCRLAIIDPLQAKQPMVYTKGDLEYVIVYNGQLYNKKELKEELQEIGYVFHTDSDTEVVLVSYIAWGVQSFHKLNGIYAFGIVCEKLNECILVRDALGVKPLFYYEYEEGILFASLLKTLLVHPFVQPIVDKEGLNQIFLLGPGRKPGSGVFKDVWEVLPGEYVLYKDGKLSKETYWKLRAMKHIESLEETIEHVKWLVQDSIQRQLVSDVGIGTMLSGGLDSSIVAKYASMDIDTISTFYIRYQDNESFFKANMYQPNQDEDFIDIMVKAIQSEHYPVTLQNEDLFLALEDAMVARDLPGMGDIDSSLYLFCKEIRKHEKVVLSGECADEIFGGYPWYYVKELLWKDTFPWMDSLIVRKGIVKEGVVTDADVYVDRLYRGTLKEVPYLSEDSFEQRRHREMFYLNIYWFMQTLLERSDRMSMANGLEIRVPFCDKRLVEYCFNIPIEMKLLMGKEKGVLREAMKEVLPLEIANRKKSPFPKTYHPKYWDLLKMRMREVLNEDGLLSYLVSKEAVEQIMKDPEMMGQNWYGQLMKAPQVLAYLIQVDYWLKDYQVKIEL